MYVILGFFYLTGMLSTPLLIVFYTLHCFREIDWGEPLTPVRAAPPRRSLHMLHGYERRDLIKAKKLAMKQRFLLKRP
jgi:hypothetical protein